MKGVEQENMREPFQVLQTCSEFREYLDLSGCLRTRCLDGRAGFLSEWRMDDAYGTQDEFHIV